jgi:hypothetical protein
MLFAKFPPWGREKLEMAFRSFALAASLALSAHGFTNRLAGRRSALTAVAGIRDTEVANDSFLGRRQWTAAAVGWAGLGVAAQGAKAAETSAAVAAPAAPAAVAAPVVWAAGFPSEVVVPYKGSELPLKRFRAKATVVVNIKTDDPESTRQLPALAYLSSKYSKNGLRVLAFPTDQVYRVPLGRALGNASTLHRA